MTTHAPTIRRVVPDEQGRLAIAFAEGGFRLFQARQACGRDGFSALAYPNVLKKLTYDAAAVRWEGIGALDAAFLHDASAPMSDDQLRRHELRVGYRNQAPTPSHPTHHVYGVYLYPFDPDGPFSLGESIGGGHAEMGGSQSFDLAGLRAWAGWREHFALSGCDWAIAMVQEADDTEVLLDRLVHAICARGGM